MFLFLRREEGQGLAEYALILLAMAALLFLSGQINTVPSTITAAL